MRAPSSSSPSPSCSAGPAMPRNASAPAIPVSDAQTPALLRADPADQPQDLLSHQLVAGPVNAWLRASGACGRGCLPAVWRTARVGFKERDVADLLGLYGITTTSHLPTSRV